LIAFGFSIILAEVSTMEDHMSKRAASIKSAIKPAKAAKTPARKKSRSNNAAVEPPAEAPKWMQTREEWRRLAGSPAKRRAFIKNVCRRIAEEFKPERIILFGSYAYGKPKPDSDIDLLVVMPFEGDYFLQAFRIRQRLALSLPMDLLVRTPEELRYRLDIGDSFMREIVERGKVMYDFSVLYRYPGSTATKAAAKAAVDACRKVRRVTRNAFGLPV